MFCCSISDIYFPDALSVHFARGTSPIVLLRLSPNGTVIYSTKVTVVSRCPLNLSQYPWDLQGCTLLLRSYAHTTDDLTLGLKYRFLRAPNSVDRSYTTASLVQFGLISYKEHPYNRELDTGQFSRLEVRYNIRYIVHTTFRKRFLVYAQVEVPWISIDFQSIIPSMGINFPWMGIHENGLEVDGNRF